MYEQIMDTFTTYVKDNSITEDNYNEYLQTETFTTFFNDITIANLGEPNFTHKKASQTKGSLVYMPDSVKDKFVSHIDIITINSFYFGALVRLEYNYPTYVKFMNDLIVVRKKFKQLVLIEDGETANIAQILIKTYLNLIYGMIDNAQSVLTSSHEAPREFIIDTTKTTILTVASFLTNKGIPIYNIETDEIHCASISLETYVELQEFYKLECNKYIDTSISTISKDEDGFNSAYYVSKKRYMLGNKARVKGLKEVKNQEVLKENKQYFGQNYPMIFPEYAL